MVALWGLCTKIWFLKSETQVCKFDPRWLAQTQRLQSFKQLCSNGAQPAIFFTTVKAQNFEKKKLED